MTSTLRRISAEEFARRLKASSKEPDKRFAFFLGAGCSVSSGIPAAGRLVRDHWLPRLKQLQGGHQLDLDTWANDEFPGYARDDAAEFYGDVIQKLFLYPDDRQLEIERLCDGRFPGFGYAALSSLISQDGGRFNVVLTTNFDDLIADALYLFTPARPLVILHESLASFIRPTRTRPLIVKLHGDNRLSPQNTADETLALKEGIEKQVSYLLNDRGLVFIGYGGNDEGIIKMLDSLPSDALPLGVFWVSGGEPQGEIRSWLESRDAIWVEKGDFDELMLLVRDAFSLAHPDARRFERVFERYKKTYSALSTQVTSLPDTAPDAPALKQAVVRTDLSFPDWWAVDLEASRVTDSDPDQADAIYHNGLTQFPNSAPLLGSYASFIWKIQKDYERAEQYYRRAVDTDTNDATNLGNYAIFLWEVRNDHKGAEDYLRRAFEADPSHAINLGNYANFLSEVRNDHDEAEKYYRRAFEADPSRANTLGNYAFFLSDKRKDYEKAGEYYRRAFEADPSNANNLGNYAGYLLAQGQRNEGLSVLENALSLLNDLDDPSLTVECWFYAFAHRPVESRPEALQNLKKVIVGGGRSPAWDLTSNIAQAERDGHPDVSWLEKLAAIISDGADVKNLETWSDWQNA